MSLADLSIEVVGWVGAGLLLLAYALLSTRRLRAGFAYQVLNLAGAAGLTVNALVHSAFPSATLNVVWLAIGVWALGALQRRKQSPQSGQHAPSTAADQCLRVK